MYLTPRAVPKLHPSCAHIPAAFKFKLLVQIFTFQSPTTVIVINPKTTPLEFSLPILQNILLATPENCSHYLQLEAFNGSGPGGQNKNRTFNGVRITEPITGIQAQSAHHRERPRNLKEALMAIKLNLAFQTHYEPKSLEDWLLNTLQPASHNPWPSHISSSHPLLASRLFTLRVLIETQKGQLDLALNQTQWSKSRLLKFFLQTKPSWVWLNTLRKQYNLSEFKPPH